MCDEPYIDVILIDDDDFAQEYETIVTMKEEL